MIVTPPRPHLVAVLTALSAGCVLLALACGLGHLPLGVDSSVYRAGALAVAHGQSPYGPLPEDPSGLPFTYPPVAALLFLPLAGLSPTATWGGFAVLSVLSVGLLVGTTVRAAAPRLRPWAGLLVVAAFGLEPVWQTVSFGQINLLLAALVLTDAWWLKGSRGGGVLIGLAAAVKLTPLIFLPYLLLAGRRADAARALGAFLGLNAVTALVLPDASGRYWGAAVLSGDDATVNGWVGNQSLNGIAHRFLGSAPWVFGLVVAVALALGLAAAVLVRRIVADRPVTALVITGLYGTAISPIAWTHHWVWVLPALLVPAGAGRRAATTALTAVSAARAVWWLPGPLAALVFPVTGAALILLLGRETRPAERPSGPAREAETVSAGRGAVG